MSRLSQLREDLKAVLTDADFHAFTVIPEKVSGAFVAVAPNDPYLAFEPEEPDLLYGEVRVRHRLVLVASRGTNDTQADELDEMVLTLLSLADGLAPHVIESVDEPGRITINGQVHLATAVNLSVPFRVQED